MIVEEFGQDRIGTAYCPSQKGVNTKNSKTKSRYKDALKANNLEEIALHEGDSINVDGITVEVLNPSPEINSKKQNQNSLALQATYDEKSVLLTGDVEGEAETRLVEEHADQLSTVDSLKVTHHGAENGTDSESLAHTQPDSLIISSGLDNRYTTEKNDYDAHPHDETLKRISDHEDDIDCYWTAYHGTTSLRIEDGELQIEAAHGQQALSEVDLAALKYYGREHDLDNEQLAEIEEFPFADLPGETPKWACEAPIVDTSQALSQVADNETETEQTAPQTEQIAEADVGGMNQSIGERIDNATDQNDLEGATLHVTPTENTDVDASFSEGDITLSIADDAQTTDGTKVDISPSDDDFELSTGDDGTLTVALDEATGTTMEVSPGAEDDADFSFGDDLTLAFDDSEVRVSPGEEDIQLRPGDDGAVQMAVGDGYLTNEPSNDPATDQTTGATGLDDTEETERDEATASKDTKEAANGLATEAVPNESTDNEPQEPEEGVTAAGANGDDSSGESDVDEHTVDKPSSLPRWMDLDYDGLVSSVDSNSKWVDSKPPKFADPWLTAPERESDERTNGRDRATETTPQSNDERNADRDDADPTLTDSGPSSGDPSIG